MMITYGFVDNRDFDFSFSFSKIGKNSEKSKIEVNNFDRSFLLSGDIAVFDSISNAAYFADGREFVMFESYGKSSYNREYRKFQYNRPIRHFNASRLMSKIGYIILKKYIRHIGMNDDNRVKEAISNKWRFWRKEISLLEYEKSIFWIDEIIMNINREIEFSSKDCRKEIKEMKKFYYLKSMLSPESVISFSKAVEWYKTTKSSKAIERYLKMSFYEEWLKSQETPFSRVLLPFSPV